MNDAAATMLAAVTTLQQRTEAADVKGELEKLAKELRREKEAREKLQKDYKQMKDHFKVMQMREHKMRGSSISNTVDRQEEHQVDSEMIWTKNEEFWKERKEESQKAHLPSKDGGALGDPREGHASLSLPSVDGGSFAETREQRISHPPVGGEILSSQERREGRRRGQDKGDGEDKPPTLDKTKPSSKRADLQSEKPKPRIVNDVMIVAPTNMNERDQEIIREAERRIAQMQEEIKSLLEVVKSLRRKSLPVRSTGPANRVPSKISQPKEQQQAKIGSKKKKEKGKKIPDGKKEENKKTPTPDISVKEIKRGEDKTAPTPTETLTWSKVVGSKEKKKGNESKVARSNKEKGKEIGSTPNAPPTRKKKKRPPRTAAVVMTCPNGTYADKIKEAREKISLDEIGIKELKIRRAATGGYMFEISGEDKVAKADRLAMKLRGGIAGVKVARPCKRIALRIKNFDASITSEEVRAALVKEGQCSLDEIKVGVIKRPSGGLGTLWAQCPLVSAIRIKKSGKIRVGWTMAKVDILPDRSLQCYKCLEGGHTMSKCPNKQDYRGRCFNRGGNGHLAQKCTNKAHCPACADRKFPANHNAGSKACRTAAIRRRGKREEVTLPPQNPLTPHGRCRAEYPGPCNPNNVERGDHEDPPSVMLKEGSEEEKKEEPKPQRKKARKRTRTDRKIRSDSEDTGSESGRIHKTREVEDESSDATEAMDAEEDL